MRIVFMGTGEIALPSLDWLIQAADVELVGVFTQPDKKIGRKQILTPPEVKVRASDHDIPVLQPDSLRKQPEFVEALEQLSPDISVVMAYGQILPKRVIAAPRVACVNLHASLLPRHRGASPIQAAIREGNAESGLTLMHIVSKLDAGDMILREAIEITEKMTGGALHDALAELGPGLLEKGLPLLANGTAPRQPQEESLVTYSGKLGREDGIIDWNQSAEALERLIRAYDPWPGTSTSVKIGSKSRKLKLFPHSRIYAPEYPTSFGTDEPPGTVLDANGSLIISCGENTRLRLIGDVQLEGKKRMPVSEFLKGYGLEAGIRLGDFR